MDISLRFKEFLLSILTFMSQLLPRSSHSPPTQPQPSQTTDPEAPPVTPVLAEQNIEQRNPQWQDIIMGFFVSHQPFKSHSSSRKVHPNFIFTFAFFHCGTHFLCSLCGQIYRLQVPSLSSNSRWSCGLLCHYCVLPCNNDSHAALPQVSHLGYLCCLGHRFRIQLFPSAGLIRFCLVGIPCFWYLCNIVV